jgi:ketosteroid isomerase-like protein
MKKIFSVIFFLFLFQSFVFSQSDAVKNKILFSMSEQEKAWNNGNIESYMAYYWNSDSLKFIGRSGITYGWNTTLQHYKISYPDKAAMGVLTFGDIKLKSLKRNLVMVTGSWKLKREKDELSGFYSLLWKKINGKWLIIVDHTS